MGFTNTPLELKISDFETNAQLRQHFKIMLNAGLGKLAQRRKSEKSFFATSEKEVVKLYNEENITDIFGISDSLCQLNSSKTSSASLLSSSNGNCILYAFITARTRILLHKNILKLIEKKFRVYYCDCDNIIFAGKTNVSLPIDIGNAFGQFRAEFGDNATLQSFVAHGRKNFKMTYKKDGEEKSVFKLSGISLKSASAAQWAEEAYPETISPTLSKVKKQVPQVRHTHEKKLSTRKQRQNFEMRENVFCQRRVDYKDLSMTTYPWGFNCSTK